MVRPVHSAGLETTKTSNIYCKILTSNNCILWWNTYCWICKRLQLWNYYHWPLCGSCFVKSCHLTVAHTGYLSFGIYSILVSCGISGLITAVTFMATWLSDTDTPEFSGQRESSLYECFHVCIYNVSFCVCLCVCVQGGSDSPADGSGGERSYPFRGQFGQRSSQDRTSLHHVRWLLLGLQHQRRKRVWIGDLCV